MPPLGSTNQPHSSDRLHVAGSWFFPLAFALIVGLWLVTRFGTVAPPPGDHQHPPGEQGGAIISLADDRYHVEALVEQGGQLRIFTLGRDPTEMIDVELQPLTAYVRREQLAAVVVKLEPDPQPDDPPGRTSQFAGQLPSELEGIPLRVTVTGLRIGRSRYRLGFVWGDDLHLPTMPAKVEDEEERRLYLVAGGRYSEADIEANGGLTPSEKFAGFRAEHDFNTQPGDPLCPITRTKANPQCDWTIDGQRYEFCCPPCIDEFVRMAKEEPERIESPDAYVQ
jgi:hypothetical protein